MFTVGRHYRLEVQSIRTKDGFKGLSAIAELKVVSAERTQPASEPSRIGTVASYVGNLSDAKKNGGGRFKAFVMGQAGAEEQELSAKFMDDTNRNLPFHGRWPGSQKCRLVANYSRFSLKESISARGSSTALASKSAGAT
ncbi:hypothetical protein JYK02_03140 [Corallococcus macrosporus]|uniref:Uncharacterized protein n=1 Tax=Corallococcus macrosporus TaxID=35 RepID=A0ABS3D4B7_9BACT|nr:hypothetical protein [Corallococcus macrosporus]